MFKIGDKVVVKSENARKAVLEMGVIYTVSRVEGEDADDADPILYLEGVEEGFFAARFRLADSTDNPLQKFPAGSFVRSLEESCDISIGEVFEVLPNSEYGSCTTFTDVVFKDNEGDIRMRPSERYVLMNNSLSETPAPETKNPEDIAPLLWNSYKDRLDEESLEELRDVILNQWTEDTRFFVDDSILDSAFDWSATKQGHSFWQAVHGKYPLLEQGESTPKEDKKTAEEIAPILWGACVEFLTEEELASLRSVIEDQAVSVNFIDCSTLLNAFQWDISSQGYDFWSALSYRQDLLLNADKKTHPVQATPTSLGIQPVEYIPTTALDVQEGGSHYKKLGIQPVEYIHANDLDYFQGNVVKYITRYKDKNGIEDVKKAIHYCQLILELQYGVKADG